MSRDPVQIPLPGFESARARWRRDYETIVGRDDVRRNRSGIEIEPLYTPRDWDAARYLDDLGFPGEPPMTRGIYASMHRGRPWSQRQLIGLGTPADYNDRLKAILEAGGTAVSLIPCNSVYRGHDADEVDPVLLGTCGTVVNTVDDMDTCFADVRIEELSTAMNDPLPFTLLALLLAVAHRRGVPWERITGTSNQSDYLSHYVANHMFFRIALPGSRRILTDHIEFCARHLPGWNPVSVVGQHMQQAGATPAQAMAFTLCTAIQYAEDCIARGMRPNDFLPRFTFFFDISMSFFEEIAKFRAGRRLWAHITRERLGATDPRAWRLKFHGQTSGVDLTRQQPLNNIARVTVQAMAGIFGGLQSLHTDAYDEVLSVPRAEAARVAVSTQNILREEAHLDEVIDPLGGSYYIESLTNRMQDEIASVMARVEDAGGMYEAARSGLVQSMIGAAALEQQERVESGKQKIVGVNAYCVDETRTERAPLARPSSHTVQAHLERLARYKSERASAPVRAALDALARTAAASEGNVYEKVVEAALAGATHGEIIARLRAEMGFGDPLVLV